MTTTLIDPAEARRYATVDVVIGTHNVGDRPKRDVIANIFEAGAEVLGCQEMADQRPADFRLPEWIDGYWPRFPPGEQAGPSLNVDANPLFWDTRVFEERRTGSRFLTGRTNVGARGAGPDVLNNKWLNWVVLHHLELDENIVIGNVHNVPSITASKARQDLMRRQVAGEVDWVNARSPKRILNLVGDFNADVDGHEGGYLDPLWKAGLCTCWVATGNEAGSLKRRAIDHVCLRDHPRATITGMQVLTRLGFDHDPVLVTESILPRAAVRSHAA